MKKIFLPLSLVAVVLFSVPPASFAQEEVFTPPTEQSNPEAVKFLNSLPEVYVQDLSLENTDYKAGDTLKGSFVLINSKDTSISNLQYQVSLVGDLMENDLYRYTFDNQRYEESIFLAGNSQKGINFSYKLPLSSSAYSINKSLGIRIRAFSATGSPLGWDNIAVKISDSGISPVIVSNASVVIGDKIFGLNYGPTVYINGQVSLKMDVYNESEQEIKNLVPKIFIYKQDYLGLPLESYSDEIFSLISKQKKTLVFNLPVFDYKPGVYAGEIVFVDENNINRSNPIQFRYIVFGEVFNILNVTTDKNTVNKGENINVSITYLGSPVDILSGNISTSSEMDLTVLLFNEKKQLIAQSYSSQNFQSSGQLELKLLAEKPAEQLIVEVKILKEGKLIAEFKSNLFELNILEEVTDNNIIKDSLIYLLVLIVLIVILIIWKVKKGKKSIAPISLLFLMIIFSFVLTNKVEAYTVINSWSIHPTYYQTITLNSPKPANVIGYVPGQTINVNATTNTLVCNNSDHIVKVFATTPVRAESLPNPQTSFDFSGFNSSNTITLLNTGEFTNDCNTENHATCDSSIVFSKNIIMPSIPGIYRSYIYAENYQETIKVSWTVGYQDFVVIDPVISGQCEASAVTPRSSAPITTSCVFNHIKYADHYLDLKAAFGYDEVKLKDHWTKWGITEGRTPCGSDAPSCKFNAVDYLNLHLDVKAVGLNGFNHYTDWGVNEGRVVCQTPSLCEVGKASAITGTGPWSWTCPGINGGTTATCESPREFSCQIGIQKPLTETLGITDSLLLSYWKLDSNTNDSKGSSNGILYNGATVTSPAIFSSGYSGAGATAHMRVGSSNNFNLTSNQSLSLSGWIKTSSSGNQPIVTRYGMTKNADCGGSNAWANDVAWYGLLIKDGKASFVIRGDGAVGVSGTETYVNGTTLINDNNWHNIVGILDKDKQQLQLYVDGNLQKTTAFADIISSHPEAAFTFTEDPLYIGATCGVNPAESSYINGQIDDISVWKRALTYCEVAEIAKGPDYCDSCPPLLDTSCSITSVTNNSVATSLVTYTATSTGGTGNYTYSWLGNNSSSTAPWTAGNNSSITRTYSSPGTYFATSTISDGVSTTTVACSNSDKISKYIIIKPNAVYPSCGTASGVPTVTAPTSNLCSSNTISINPMPSDGGTQWFWGCVGQNTGWKDNNNQPSDTFWCFAPKTLIIDPLSEFSPSCSFGPIPNSPIQVNTKTVWSISPSANTTNIRWEINGVIEDGETSASLEKYFNTVGVKTVRALVNNSTHRNECTATTTVVQTGGGIQEL